MTDNERKELLLKAKPILFNTEMVRAILDGKKTVTRRVLKPHNSAKAKRSGYYQGEGLWYDDEINAFDKDTHIKDYSVSCCWIETKIYIRRYAPYKIGDILYVRETWAELETVHGVPYWAYKADDQTLHHSSGENFERWHPSIHMPKEAARVFLRVTNVRVERLQDISDRDLICEGEIPIIHVDESLNGEATRMSFLGTWNSTIKKSDLAKYGWAANPWVWVIEFERID